MCGGITVFAPLVLNNIAPTDQVGVVGIGGLGHMAIKFAKAWGCEVTAFTHSASKLEEARKLGADHVVSSVDGNAIRALAGKLDMLLVTVNVPLDWQSFIGTLAPNGTLAHRGRSVRTDSNSSIRSHNGSAHRDGLAYRLAGYDGQDARICGTA